jgi:hypothetical protein
VTTSSQPDHAVGTARTLRIVTSFPAPGDNANSLTWDGTNLWVSDNSGYLFSLGLQGNVRASYLAPDPTPEGITWDGSTFWLFTTNHAEIDHFQIQDGRVSKLGAIRPPAQVTGGGITHDLAWDNGTLWWAEAFRVYHLTTSGVVIGQFTSGRNVTGLGWDGRHLWLAHGNFPDGSLVEVDGRDGRTLDTFTIPVTELSALAWADRTLWALGTSGLTGKPQIFRLDVSAAG